MSATRVVLALTAVECFARIAYCFDLQLVRTPANRLQIDDKQGFSVIRLPRQELPHNQVFYQADPPAAAHGAVTCNSQRCAAYCSDAPIDAPPGFAANANASSNSCMYAFETVIEPDPEDPPNPLKTITIEKVKASCCCAYQQAFFNCVTEDDRAANTPNHQGILAQCHPAACRTFCQAYGLQHIGCGLEYRPPDFDNLLRGLIHADYEAWACSCFRREDSWTLEPGAVGFKEAIPLWEGAKKHCATTPRSTSFRPNQAKCLPHENAGRICVPLTITVVSSVRKRKRALQTGNVSRSEKPKLRFLEILAGK